MFGLRVLWYFPPSEASSHAPTPRSSDLERRQFSLAQNPKVKGVKLHDFSTHDRTLGDLFGRFECALGEPRLRLVVGDEEVRTRKEQSSNMGGYDRWLCRLESLNTF
ncbi:hypothetical protein FRB95_013559 [Tulasnella sp. JGI-2019a]|nr:hypothetical protein FRB95_013559 [Tulasnella sp. JGI-2019a]